LEVNRTERGNPVTWLRLLGAELRAALAELAADLLALAVDMAADIADALRVPEVTR
jgi:hypothetical protein